MDAVVQSTDKNFMVPVGGSVIAAGPGKAGFIDAVNAAYPGRASASPMLDLLMTLLFWGKQGWQEVLKARLWAHCRGYYIRQAQCYRLCAVRRTGKKQILRGCAKPL